MDASVCGAVLCGGQSHRMGQDKAKLLWRGRTLLESAMYQLSHLDAVTAVETDLRPGCGPLGGIHTALTACLSDAVFVTSCDTPLVDDGVVRLLREALGDSDAAIALDPGGANPLCALYRRRCLPLVVWQLDSGDYSPQRLCKRLDARYVPVEPEKLVNINTPEDYRAFLKAEGNIPVCAFSGWADSGKTTFLEQLIPLLRRRGLRVAALKHCHHALEAGGNTDTARLRAAGADMVLPVRGALPRLGGVAGVDLIVAEGFKDSPWPKVWMHRAGLEPPVTGKPFLAMVSDAETRGALPRFGWEDAAGVADFLTETFLRREGAWNRATSAS